MNRITDSIDTAIMLAPAGAMRGFGTASTCGGRGASIITAG